MPLEINVLLENEPPTGYKSGDLISGNIAITNSGKKPSKIEELSVSLIGQELVEWKEEKFSPCCCFYGFGCIFRCTKKKSYRDGRNFIDQTIPLLGESMIPLGRHNFPFQFALPYGCPSSYIYNPNSAKKSGHVAYSLLSKLKTTGAFKSNEKDFKNVCLIGDLDLNEFDAATPISQEKVDKKGKRRVIVQLSKQGYTPGEAIPFKILFHFDSSQKKPYQQPIIKLIKEENLVAKSFGKQTKTYKTVITQKTHNLPTSSDFEWIDSLTLPQDLDLTNLGGSEYIGLKYRIYVSALGLEDLVIPIVVGSVPIGQQIRVIEESISNESEIQSDEEYEGIDNYGYGQ